MLFTWFAHPALLLALTAIPVCAALMLFARIRRHQMVAKLGSSLTLRKSVLMRPRVRRWKSLCIVVGIALLGIAAAGPQWGIDKDAQVRKGRDVIVVFDLSRSMTAEQPSRREFAIRALRHLADTFEEHGGNRVGLIVFAAKPDLLFPLTADCDHLRHVLTQIETDDLPSLAVESPLSGTRIGAALKLAVNSADPRRTNRPVIVLLSDGDDPAAKDGEWADGVAAAKAKQIRIHTVGFGDPHKDETIPAGRDVLMYDGKPALTKLDEALLKEIAKRTGGIYLPAHRQEFPLGTFVQHLLDADDLRDEAPDEGALPVYQLRYAWFLFPAALLFMLSFVLNEGPSVSRKEPAMPSTSRPRTRSRGAHTAALAIIVGAIACISAGDPPGIEAMLRQGNDAFARGEYADAIKAFERAEPLTLDPGLISFNKAAAHYRLAQQKEADKQHAEAMAEYKEAIAAYRRCLQDDRAPTDRRARANFDLGNALVQYAGEDYYILTEAVAAYRACLHERKLLPKLRADARHNLEVAQLRWLKAREKLPPDQKDPPDSDKAPYQDTQEPEDYTQVEPGKNDQRQKADNLPSPSAKSKTVGSTGAPKSLPDDENIRPLPPEDALATLAEHVRRIAAARRLYRNPPIPGNLTTKDW